MATAIPSSSSCVRVSLIDPGTRLNLVSPNIFLDPIPTNLPLFPALPAYSFLIQHPSGKNYLFDLSVPKDWKTSLPASSVKFVQENGWDVDVPHGVDEVLVAAGIELTSINGIIWSHWHWDHVGDTSLYPPETDLLVGQGVKEAYMPVNWPTKPDGNVNEAAWANRTVKEITFDGKLQVAGHDAVDFFGDGSFYLLNSYGHTIGHISGLARTTSNTFILMGGDTCHYPGQYRPSSAKPIPENVIPHPFEALSNPRAFALPCPGAMFQKAHPAGKLDEPFFTMVDAPDGGMNYSRVDAIKSRDKLIALDALDEVWVIIAHDPSLLDYVDFFPKGELNAWKEKDWKEATQWRFLGNFKDSVKEGQA